MRSTRVEDEVARGEDSIATGKSMEDDTSTSSAVLPLYLTKHYAWAYVWPVSIWFFDHQPIINAILFGNYNRILNQTLRLMDPENAGRTLQIASVYGKLTPCLAEKVDDLHVIDCVDRQLEVTGDKLSAVGKSASLRVMLAEELGYEDDEFNTALMFLLLHEIPTAERNQSLREAIRVVRPGGSLVIAEYGAINKRHLFHRFAPMRWVLTTAEPQLNSFWKEDLEAVLGECAKKVNKTITLDEHVDIFGGFYRVMRYRIA